MANEKILNTRVQLKYDSYANWDAVKAIFKPLKGEICIVNPGTKLNDATTTPCLMKVGDGTNFFKDLQWVSAIAADVYAWAKKPAPDWADFPALPIEVEDKGTGKFVTGFTYADNKFTITRSDVQWTDVKGAPDFALAADLGNVTTLTTTAKTAVGAINEHDVEIGNLTSLNTTNKGNLVAAINETLQAVEVGGTGSVVTVTKQETPTTGSEATYVVNQGGKAVDVKIEIPKYDTSADYGVLEVKGDAQSGVQVDTTDAQKPIVKIKANTYDAYGAAAAVQQNLTEYQNAHKDDYTNSKIDELVDAVEDKVDAIKVPVYSVTKDATSEYAATYHLTKDGVNIGTAINIPKDLVVESGKVETFEDKGAWGEAGTYIILTLANATNDKIYVNVGSLIEYVTSGSTNDSQVIIDIDANHKVTATIGAGKVGLTELSDEVKNAIAKDDNTTYTIAKKANSDFTFTVTPSEGDPYDVTLEANGKADKAVPAAAGNFAGLDANGNLIDSGKKAADFKTVQQAVTSPTTDGLAIEFIDTISQDANGVITATKKKVDLPEDKNTQTPWLIRNNGQTLAETNFPLKISATPEDKLHIITIGGGLTTSNNSGSDFMTGIDYEGALITIENKGVTTAKIADHAVGAHQTKACQDYTGDDAEVWVFDCGSATVNV